MTYEEIWFYTVFKPSETCKMKDGDGVSMIGLAAILLLDYGFEMSKRIEAS